MLNKCKKLLLDKKINPASSIDYEINGKIHTLSLEAIIDAYLQTEKKEYFLEMLEKVIKTNENDVSIFFQHMGQLILLSSLSEKDIKNS